MPESNFVAATGRKISNRQSRDGPLNLAGAWVGSSVFLPPAGLFLISFRQRLEILFSSTIAA
jgi:hypothetical protein